MSDFIREVDEEYRRERAVTFLKRFQVPLAVLAVLVVAGAGGWRFYVDRQMTRAQGADSRYQDAETLAHDGQGQRAEAGFRALAADGPAGYALLARLRAAEVLGGTDAEAGARQLDAIASDEGAGAPALRDLARYRSALLRLDIQDPKAFDAQYGRFALESFTFNNGMRELLALAAMKRADRAGASRYLDAVAADPLATPALRNRVQLLRELNGGGAVTPLQGPVGAAAVTPLNGTPATAEIAPVETLPPATAPVPPPTASPSAAPASGEPAAAPSANATSAPAMAAPNVAAPDAPDAARAPAAAPDAAK